MPGIKQSALLGMIDIPEDLLSEILADRTALIEEYNKAKERFDFPLSSLFNQATNGDCSTFGLNDEFEQQLIEEHTGFAVNKDQVKVFEAMQTFANSVNNLINLGICRPNNINWLHEDGPFNSKVLSFDPFSTSPVTLSKHMFSQISLGMFNLSLAKYRSGKVRSSSYNTTEETDTESTTNVAEVPDTVQH